MGVHTRARRLAGLVDSLRYHTPPGVQRGLSRGENHLLPGRRRIHTGDFEVPSVRLVRLVKALGDERRLRILKRLATGSYTLQQLADYFDVGKTLMHHHLVVLRAAGLVHLLGDDNKKYRLRRDTLAQLAPLLEGYLLDKPL